MKVLGVTKVVGGTLASLVGIMLGVGGYTFYYADGASYLSNDPRACVNCHIMREQYDGWQKAGHHAVATCNDCHVPHEFIGKWLTKALNGFHHSRSFTFQDFHEPIQIRPVNLEVLNRNCIHCHGEFTSDIRMDAGADYSGRVHDKTKTMDCVRCHELVGHGAGR